MYSSIGSHERKLWTVSIALSTAIGGLFGIVGSFSPSGIRRLPLSLPAAIGPVRPAVRRIARRLDLVR
jgi:hypothetical protein